MNQKKALYIGFGFIAVFAIVMVSFYKLKEMAPVSSLDAKNPVVTDSVVHSPFEGIYTPDGLIEAAGKRVSYFSVNKRDEALGASVKVDTLGSDQEEFLECDVLKLEDPAFYVKCENAEKGTVSFDGKILRDGSVPSFVVDGKLLWQINGQVLEKNMRFTHMQE